jgi:hypothetical protein
MPREADIAAIVTGEAIHEAMAQRFGEATGTRLQ